MLTRITFLNYGTLEQLFISESEKEAKESFWEMFGSVHVPRNTGGVRVVAIDEAVDVNDRGGWAVGSTYKPSHLELVA